MQTETTIDVAEIVSDDQVKFFVDNGYLVVNNLIDSEELQELRDDLIDIALGKYPCKGLVPPKSDVVTHEPLLFFTAPT